MEFAVLDYCLFVAYLVLVVGLAILMSWKRRSSGDYFLAGRKLTWGLIGVSMVALHVSMNHCVGMASAGYRTGLAVASYEWMAAVAVVLVALFLLPTFLRRGIYTIPEYLESRYSPGARGLMAFLMVVAYLLVIIPAVLYSGASWMQETFGLRLLAGVWVIGLIAGVYTVWGGLKAVVWANMLNGLGLILGGTVLTILGFHALGAAEGTSQGVGAFLGDTSRGMNVFILQAGDKLSVVKPWGDPEVPWIGVFIGGLWVLQLFYWGLNQSTVQRALGAQSLSQGQKGLILAAGLKLLIPFLIILPAIMALQLYGTDIKRAEAAYPHIAYTILPRGLRGLMFAALLGAVLSALDSMFHSASTILSIDFYKRHLNKNASERALVWIGRAITAVLVIVACLWAPQLGRIAGYAGVLGYLQTAVGLLAPGIATVFLFGLLSRRAPAQAACGTMLLGPPIYAFLLWAMPHAAFLYHVAFTFAALAAYTIVVTLLSPLRDAEASSKEGEAEAAEGPSGLLANYLAPFCVAAACGAVAARPLFSTCAEMLPGPSWVHYVVTAVAVAILVVGGGLILRGRLIACATAVVGSCLLFQPIFHFSMTFLPDERFLWVHYLPPAVAVAVYFLAALFVMELPAPAVRRTEVPAEEAPTALRPAAAGHVLKFAALGLLGSVLLGLHVYLFCTEAARYWPETAGWERSFRVAVPWAVAAEEAAAEEPAEGEAKEAPKPPPVAPKARAPKEGAPEGKPPEEPAPKGQPAPEPPGEAKPAQEKPAGEEAAEASLIEEGGDHVRIFLAPALISLGAVIAFLAALILIWWRPPLAHLGIGLGTLVGAAACGLGGYELSVWVMPTGIPARVHVAAAEVAAGLFTALVILICRGLVPPKAEVAANTEIDLTPSRFGGVWGVLVIAATAVLFTLFL